MNKKQLVNGGLLILTFIIGFYIFNLLPLLKVAGGGSPFSPPDSMRWCSLNYWYCYSDFGDPAIPNFLKSQFLALFMLPIVLPTLFSLLVFKLTNRKGPVTVVLVIPAVILAVVAGYFALQLAVDWVQRPKVLRQPTPRAVSETTSWQTYSNTRYSYTIKYPSNWYVETTYSEKDFTQRGPVEDNEFIGGDTSFSNYQNSSSYNLENPAPKDLYSAGFMIYKTEPAISYDQFISSKHFGYDEKENISINGISALRLIGVSTDHPVGVTVVNTLVKVGNKMFVFNYSGSPIPQQEKDIVKKIINSFTTK